MDQQQQGPAATSACGGGAAAPTPPRLIALSLKARGWTVSPAIPRDPHRLLPELRQTVYDLSIAIGIQIVLLSWSCWLSVLLVILCCVFWANYAHGVQAAAGPGIMIPVALLVYLPCLWLAFSASSRRLEAQRHLDQVQSHVLGMYMIHSSLGGCGAPHLLAQLDDAISDAMLQLQAYLSRPRSLSSQHFGTGLLSGEQLPANSRVFALAADAGQRLRQVHSCMRRLSEVAGALLAHCSSSASPGQPYAQQALCLVQLLVPLCASLQALLAAKDLRSPLLLRAMLRPGVVLVAPLLSGAFLAGPGLIGRPVTAAGQVFAIVVGCILQVLLMSLYGLGCMLEDPFDTGPAAAPDTLSLLEFMHTLAYLTAPEDVQGHEEAAVAQGRASSNDVVVDVVQQHKRRQQEQQLELREQQQQQQQQDCQQHAPLAVAEPPVLQPVAAGDGGAAAAARASADSGNKQHLPAGPAASSQPP